MVKKINTRRKTRKTLKRRYQKKSKRRYQKKSKRRSRKMRGGAAAGGGDQHAIDAEKKAELLEQLYAAQSKINHLLIKFSWGLTEEQKEKYIERFKKALRITETEEQLNEFSNMIREIIGVKEEYAKNIREGERKVLQDEFESIKEELIEYRGPGYDINKDLEKFPIDELLRIMLIQEEGGHPF